MYTGDIAILPFCLLANSVGSCIGHVCSNAERPDRAVLLETLLNNFNNFQLVWLCYHQVQTLDGKRAIDSSQNRDLSCTMVPLSRYQVILDLYFLSRCGFPGFCAVLDTLMEAVLKPGDLVLYYLNQFITQLPF